MKLSIDIDTCLYLFCSAEHNRKFLNVTDDITMMCSRKLTQLDGFVSKINESDFLFVV